MRDVVSRGGVGRMLVYVPVNTKFEFEEVAILLNHIPLQSQRVLIGNVICVHVSTGKLDILSHVENRPAPIWRVVIIVGVITVVTSFFVTVVLKV